ncbi:MAG TPA: YbfB/YjiJ family MFS transporter [Alphaproteobacteria bacterium]|nr:YbfB/YjiJ family MFS transporter [Alphaproteobacteria bacterium]
MAASLDRAETPPPARVAFAALAGLCASLVGIGLARFAYTPLIPPLISEGWFGAAAAAYLGAANLAGYLAGALVGHVWIRWFRAASVLRAAMLVTAASLLACVWRDGGFAWFFAWRVLSGYTGGVIMVLAAPTVLLATPPGRRGLVGGAIFTGVGIGIAASGTLVPYLLSLDGLVTAWLGLGGLSLVLTLVGWFGWPREPRPHAASLPEPPRSRTSLPVAAMLAGYGLNALGLVPHMLFLVVYIAQGLGRGLAAGAGYWVLFGVGAVTGPLIAGQLGDRIGFGRATRLVYLVEAAMVLLPYLSTRPLALGASSLVIGACVPGITSLVLGRVHELVEGQAAQRRVWGQTTIAWAIAQGASAFAYSYLIGRLGGYAPLFLIGAIALAFALALDVAAARAVPRAG